MYRIKANKRGHMTDRTIIKQFIIELKSLTQALYTHSIQWDLHSYCMTITGYIIHFPN